VRKNDSTRELRLAPLTREEAELTSKWRYGPELATYDGTAAGIEDMLDPANHYHSIRLDGEYVGYVCVGADARVPDLPAVADVDDIGIGLAPDRVGRGLSRWLLPSVIESLEARGALTGSVLRAVVLDWNGRSLTAAQRAGFALAGEHRVGERRFIVITRPRTTQSRGRTAGQR
jgi:ribosomal-protein-alanine N-acetyltransferase